MVSRHFMNQDRWPTEGENRAKLPVGPGNISVKRQVVKLNFITKIAQLSLNHNRISTALLFSARHVAAILDAKIWSAQL
jgi:hypothetical protein